MKLARLLTTGALVLAAGGLAACGDDGDDSAGGGTRIQTDAQTSGGDGPSAEDLEDLGVDPGDIGDIGDGPPEGLGGPPGATVGTLTIGDESWEFRVDSCLTPPETGSDDLVFVASSRQDGTVISVIRRAGPGGEDRDFVSVYEGDDTFDPDVSWEAEGAFLDIDDSGASGTAEFADFTLAGRDAGRTAEGTVDLECPQIPG